MNSTKTLQTLTLKALAGAAALALSGAALAHPGHSEAASFFAGFAHPLSGLDHLLAMLAVGVWAAQSGGRSAWRLPLTFVAAMLAGAGLGLSGVSVPGVEPMIAASVLVLGLLVALRVPLRAQATGTALIAAFAVFHGIAHGAGVPAGSALAAYIAGFALATAVLHALGVRLGFSLHGGSLRARVLAGVTGVPVAIAGAVLMVQAMQV